MRTSTAPKSVCGSTSMDTSIPSTEGSISYTETSLTPTEASIPTTEGFISYTKTSITSTEASIPTMEGSKFCHDSVGSDTSCGPFLAKNGKSCATNHSTGTDSALRGDYIQQIERSTGF